MEKKIFNVFLFLMLSIFVHFDSLSVFAKIKLILQRNEQRTLNMLSTIMCMKTRYPLKCTVAIIYAEEQSFFSA